MEELRTRNKIHKHEKELFKSKLLFTDVTDELKTEFVKGRYKPSNIKNRRSFGRWYSVVQWFGY